MLLGVRIHAFTVASLHACIANVVRSGQRAIFANVNVNAMNLAVEMPSFRAFLHQSDYVFCDGHGVMLGARMLGQRLPEKITYAAWLPQAVRCFQSERLSIFLLGGKPGVATRAAERLVGIAPGLRIAGTHHGYFDHAAGAPENAAVVQAINAANPDILLVCLGMPAQEHWLSANWQALNARIALTGGAALDYAAGDARRPPRWMTAIGLEWLGRLRLEPRRLWRRYLIGNPLFLWRVLRSGKASPRTRIALNKTP